MDNNLLTCPFCGESEFDDVGLKYHLIKFCEKYDKVLLTTKYDYNMRRKLVK